MLCLSPKVCTHYVTKLELFTVVKLHSLNVCSILKHSLAILNTVKVEDIL